MSYSLLNWLTHLETLNAEFTQAQLCSQKHLVTLRKIAHSLDLLNVSWPVITVAGTNGKGSCVALLSAIYCAGGYRVGSFSSPHLLHYNERIQINQQPVSDRTLCEAFKEIEAAREGALLRYFGFTVLTGLWLFKQAKLDIMILEVGLGGRLDPVNLIDADIALISSISLDHTHILGNTVEEIALEKAGIMRSKKPCIWGDSYLASNVKAYADKLEVPLFVHQKDFSIEETALQDSSENTWTWSNKSHRLEDLPFPNITYLPNAGCVLQAINLLQSRLPVSQATLKKGLREVKLWGRFQMIEGKIKTLLDIAHNPASAELLAHNIKKVGFPGKIFIVIATLNTKDIKGILSPLVSVADHWYFSEFNWPTCTLASKLVCSLKLLSQNPFDVFESVEKAYKAALKRAKPNDVVVVTGSFHTVGAVMEYLSVYG